MNNERIAGELVRIARELTGGELTGLIRDMDKAIGKLKSHSRNELGMSWDSPRSIDHLWKELDSVTYSIERAMQDAGRNRIRASAIKGKVAKSVKAD